MATERTTKPKPKPKPKIKNVEWRGEVAHARYRYKGRTYTASLETSVPGDAKRLIEIFIHNVKSAKTRRTFAAAAAVMKQRHYPTIRKSTQEKYTNSLSHLYDALGSKDVSQITLGDIADFHASMLKRKLSTASIRHDITVLSIMLESCIDDDVISENVAKRYMRRTKKQLKPKQRNRYLALDEDAQLIAALTSRKSNRAYAEIVVRLIKFITATGLRVTEALSLRWTSVDFAANEITVEAVLSVGDGDGDDVRTKSGLSRRVPLLPLALEGLGSPPADRTALVFGSKDGYQLDRKAVHRAIARAARTAKLSRGVTVHDLRRTCGVRLLRGQHKGIKKLTMQEVSLWLGHGSIAVTEQVYAWLDADSLHAAIE